MRKFSIISDVNQEIKFLTKEIKRKVYGAQRFGFALKVFKYLSIEEIVTIFTKTSVLPNVIYLLNFHQMTTVSSKVYKVLTVAEFLSWSQYATT